MSGVILIEIIPWYSMCSPPENMTLSNVHSLRSGAAHIVPTHSAIPILIGFHRSEGQVFEPREDDLHFLESIEGQVAQLQTPDAMCIFMHYGVSGVANVPGQRNREPRSGCASEPKAYYRTCSTESFFCPLAHEGVANGERVGTGYRELWRQECMNISDEISTGNRAIGSRMALR
ncbi:hypothetical protein C8R44DRAFT_744205 [Mycena epipterygia]|nr:hypothetical protein C8R44DRAFT_744205 [Mycena epipterygia]